jgi:hypothetical protein
LGVAAFVTAPAHAEQIITIGFVNPQTGPFAALGKAARKGMDLALDGAKSNPALKGVSFSSAACRPSSGRLLARPHS